MPDSTNLGGRRVSVARSSHGAATGCGRGRGVVVFGISIAANRSTNISH